jgi:hypothetical protein
MLSKKPIHVFDNMLTQLVQPAEGASDDTRHVYLRVGPRIQGHLRTRIP